MTTATGTRSWISYARASTEEQTTSCAQQHADNTHAAGTSPAARFEDEGVPGSVPVEERQYFARMLDFLRASKPGTYTVRFYDTSRLGRFLDQAAGHFAAKKVLAQAGARAVVYTKGSYTPGRSLGNDVLEVVEAAANRGYCEKLSRDVHRGLIAQVREGKRSGGVPAWGYDVEYPDFDGRPWARVRFVPVGNGARRWEKHVTYADGRTEVISPEHRFVPRGRHADSRVVPSAPDRVEAVRTIFALYGRGRGYRHIARTLQAQGLSSPQGTVWTAPAVRSILENPVYTGRAAYGRRSESKYHRLEAGGVVRELGDDEVPAKRQMHIADEGRWVVAENAHEGLISDEEWRTANLLREERGRNLASTGGRSRPRVYLLTGVMCCPRCGHAYTGWTATSGKGYVTSYYLCGNYTRGGGCSRGSVRAGDADEAVLNVLRARLPARFGVEDLRADMRRTVEREVGPEEQARPDPRAVELAAVESDLKAIVEKVDPANLDLFNDRLTRLRLRRTELSAGLAACPATEAPRRVNLATMTEEALEVALKLRDLLAGPDASDPEDARDLRDILPAFVKRIEPRPEEGELLVEVYRVPRVGRKYGESGRGEAHGTTTVRVKLPERGRGARRRALVAR